MSDVTTPLLINEEPRGRSRDREAESDRIELQGQSSSDSLETLSTKPTAAKAQKPGGLAFVGNATASDWAKVFKKKKAVKIKKKIVRFKPHSSFIE